MDERPSTTRPDDVGDPPGLSADSADTEPRDAGTDPGSEADRSPGPQARAVRGSGTPPVVAVVVTRDAGPQLAETLRSVGDQVYANLSTLVVDAGSPEDPTPFVAEVLPSAFVRRIDGSSWAAAANSVLDSVEGAAFLLFLHDDVALAPGSVQALVEEAFRANAGIVGPKLVDWDRPDLLRSIGTSVDRFGFTWPIAESGELDQSQHDAAREVFTVSTAALLIRADLFKDIGGFSTDIDGAGEGLDLCWRAKVAGGRTVIMPAARVRHREDSVLGDPADPHRSLTLRHQIRTALVCYSLSSLAKVMLQSLVLIPGDVLLSLVSGRSREVRSILGALAWNVGHVRSTLRIRSQVSRSRHLDDSEIKKLQLTGSARISALTRGTAGADSALSAMGNPLRALPGSVGSSNPPWVIGVWVALAALILLGSRSLIAGGVPAVRDFLPFADASTMWSEWWAGWRTTGMGAATPAPTILGLAGAAQSLVWFDGLVRTALLLGSLVWGPVALWRMLGPRISPFARVAGLVAYCLNPLPYNAIAEGRWQALVLYAATPALLSALFQTGGWEPFARTTGRESTVRAVGRLALVIAIAASVAPVVSVMVVILAILVATSVRLSPDAGGGGLRSTAVGLALGLVAALALHLPWTLAVMSASNRWATLMGSNPSGSAPPDLMSALRFDTGPAGGALGLGLWIAPLVALAVARGTRFRWAVLSVSMATMSLVFVVVAGRLSPGVAMPSTEVLLAPAVTGIALGVAMWVEAFVVDVSGGSFSWRQIASGVALVGAVVGSLPIVGLVADGRWGAPASDIERSLEEIGDELDAQRTLRIGDPDALAGRGWSFDDDLDYSVTDGPTSSLTNLFPHGRLDGETALGEALGIASRGETTRLGALLAPFGIDYLLVVERLAPLPYGEDLFDASGPLPSSLEQQVDLQRVEVVPGISVYRNTAVLPRRAAVESRIGEAVTDLSGESVIAAGAIEALPVLEDARGLLEYRGEVPEALSVIVADNRDESWSLTVDDRPSATAPAFTWASRYDSGDGGTATLARSTSFAAVVGHIVQLLALGLVVVAMLARPLRPRRPTRSDR